MRARVLALALAAAAAAVHLLVTLPLRQQSALEADEYRRSREERQRVQSRLARLERGEALLRRAAAVFATPAAEDAVRLARRTVIGSLQGLPVSNVRVSVRPGSRDEVATAVTLDAEGDFEDVIRLSGQVARPGTGLVLQTVTFARRRPSVSLTVDAVAPAPRGRS